MVAISLAVRCSKLLGAESRSLAANGAKVCLAQFTTCHLFKEAGAASPSYSEALLPLLLVFP